jgi:hypothetical protein
MISGVTAGTQQALAASEARAPPVPVAATPTLPVSAFTNRSLALSGQQSSQYHVSRRDTAEIPEFVPIETA